jgi:flagellar biosynthesis protein FliP
MLCRSIRQCALSVSLSFATGILAFAQATPTASPAGTVQSPASPVAASAIAAPAPSAAAPIQAATPNVPPANSIAQATPPAALLPPATAVAAPANPAAGAVPPAPAPAVNAAAPNAAAGPAASATTAASPGQPPAPAASAQPVPVAVPALNPAGGLQIGVHGESVPWSIVILLTGLTLVPTILLCVTPFARLLIVFHFLRQALGLQTTPSNQTLIGLSLILTFFLMQPVGQQIYESSIVPMQAGQITAMEALSRGEVPMRKFMSHYVREKDVALFVELAKEPRPHSVDDLSMRVLLPAYILSELKAGFQIGTVLFLPFLIVDMVVASITTAVGMLQLPPVVISTPLKLLLFLMVDGWHLLISSLMRSFS